MPNRYLLATKEYLTKLIGFDKAQKYNEILERTSQQIITETDFRNFVQMIIDLYESGYMKSYEDCREEFEKHGIQIKVGSQTI